MPKLVTTLLIASAFVAGLTVVPALYAQDSRNPGRSTMGNGMMGGMSGMNMMGQMSQMMDHCNQMMGASGSGRPNEQWRQQAPKTPEKKS